MTEDSRHLALFVSGFSSGGVPRLMLALGDALALRGHRVDFVVTRSQGPLREKLSSDLRLIELAKWQPRLHWKPQKNRHKVLASLPALMRYLRREKPEVLLSGGNYVNAVAAVAHALVGSATRHVLSHHATMTRDTAKKPFVRWAARHLYPKADAIVAVSDGVADDLSAQSGIQRDRIATIYNPIVTPELLEQAQAPLDHPWFAPDAPPVLLGVGRLHEQKDFPNLVRAFARVRAEREARLMILGEGKTPESRRELLELATGLGVADAVALPGFVENPFAYMAHAAVFVLSSAWEGFGNVLAEALACGCPVVSTDCPSGPSEILENGKYGPLVPIGDDAALAAAIISTLDAPLAADRLRARGTLYSVDRGTESYLKVLLGPNKGAL
jgi:glycosyltransferase involved in cell wall biosynthesis